MKILTKNKTITLNPKSINPQEFFQTREGLYVWEDFKDRIVSKAKEVNLKKYKLTSFELKERGNDEEIEAELPQKHLFWESEACSVVADLISKQPKGEEGTLLNNDYANLFYTGSYVVRVYWDSGHREWGVDACDRHDYRWNAGLQVFSPETLIFLDSDPQSLEPSDTLSLESRIQTLESQMEMILNWAKKLAPPEL